MPETVDIVVAGKPELASPGPAGAAASPRSAISAPMLDLIQRVAMDPSADVGKIERLLQMQREIMADEAKALFAEAKRRVSRVLPRINKRGRIVIERDGVVKSTQQFAKYEDLMEVIGPILDAEGFTLDFDTEPGSVPGEVCYVATLTHAAGHSEQRRIALPDDKSGSKNILQARGSSFSYAQRYLLKAHLNLVTVNEDNDGNSSTVISQDQANWLIDAMLFLEMGPEGESRIVEFCGVKTISEIKQQDFPRVYNVLKKRLAAKRAQQAGGGR